MREGLLAEFETPEALAAAIRALRQRGYRALEAYTPFIVHEVEEALAVRRSRLPWLVFAIGVSAAAGAYSLQWLLNAYLYPLDAGGRPPHMPLAFVLITFEMGILFAGLTAFLSVLVRAGALRLWDPVFEVKAFESASIDRFWLEVDARDEHYDGQATARLLEEQGASHVARFGGRSP